MMQRERQKDYNIVTTRCYRSQIIQGGELQYNNWRKNIENSPLDLSMGYQSLRNTQCSYCTLLNGYPRHFGYIPLQLPIYYLSFLLMLSLQKCCQVRLTLKETNILIQAMLHCVQKHHLITYNQRFSRRFQRNIDQINNILIAFFEQIGNAKKLSKVDASMILLENMDINAFYAWNLKTALYLALYQLNEQFDLLISIIPAPQAKCQVKQQMQIQDELKMNLKIILYHNDLEQKQTKEGKDGISILKIKLLTQTHYFHYFNRETLCLPQFSSQDEKVDYAIYQRLKGKRGRLRGSLSCKRAEITARSIISPDLNLG
ncbi:unnamed protein product [Paramecium primaurelia]|uniref:DNA-directed RNA polymerase n=1 Tax=Paramecium primaurelia TaxID=5886 RepID=A0A8S1PR88_PARPR|nr:unnamed protein product [Paramecium primaurelia]